MTGSCRAAYRQHSSSSGGNKGISQLDGRGAGAAPSRCQYNLARASGSMLTHHARAYNTAVAAAAAGDAAACLACRPVAGVSGLVGIGTAGSTQQATAASMKNRRKALATSVYSLYHLLCI
jgi:hypothetical protein